MFGFLRRMWPRRRVKRSHKDLMHSLRMVLNAVIRASVYKNWKDAHRVEFSMREIQALIRQINDYLDEDKLYIHHAKKAKLHDAVKEMRHFVSVCRYQLNNQRFDDHELQRIFHHFQTLLSEYAKSGSVYVFRHCDKGARKSASGKDYSGIPAGAIKAQAMVRAREIIDEILLSPKKVRIVTYNSEMKRTALFGELIIREIMYICRHLLDQKISFIRRGIAKPLRMDTFSDEALAEMEPIMAKKGEPYMVINWFDRTNEVANLKHLPDCQKVALDIKDFVTGQKELLSDPEYYTIVLAFSHSGIIDAFLMKFIPGYRKLVEDEDRLIPTAGFFKYENDQVNYRGVWANTI